MWEMSMENIGCAWVWALANDQSPFEEFYGNLKKNLVIRGLKLSQVSGGCCMRLLQNVLGSDGGIRPLLCAMGPKLVLVAEPWQ